MDTDLVRRLVVTASMLICVVGTLFGVGVFGPPVEDSAGGALAADATLIAPAGPAFSIWSVIYAGLGAYVIWQWLPANSESTRARAAGWFAAASMLLNASWLLVVQQGWLWLSVVVIAVLAVVLKILVARLVRMPADSLGERVVVDGTFGIYLGWVAVATCANIAAALVDSGVAATGLTAEVAALGVLAAVLGLAIFYSRWLKGRWSVAAAMAWGTGWIAHGRISEAPESMLVGIAAILVAIGITLTVPVARFWPPPRPSAAAATD